MSRYEILSAVPTSFQASGALDLDGTRSIFRHVAKSGNEGAFILGTTGEFPAVSREEFAAIVQVAAEELAGTMRVIAHVGHASAYEATARVRAAAAVGITEFAALTPYYLPSSDAEITEYFREVAEEIAASTEAGRLYVYIYPARSGNQVSPELLRALAQIPGVVGAKVSELSLEHISAYRQVSPAGFDVYTGADRDLVAADPAGADGVVSGVSAVLPRPFRALADAARAGDAEAVARAQDDVDRVVSVIGGNMARMKTALRIMDVADGVCRMALTPPDPQTVREIERVVAQYR